MTQNVTLRCLDLFSGRGTASKPFRDRGWDVVTVELDPSHSPDITADLLDWRNPFHPHEFDFIWASPPCRVFSRGSGGRHFRRLTTGRERWYPVQSGNQNSNSGQAGSPDPGSGRPGLARPLQTPAEARPGGPGLAADWPPQVGLSSYRFQRSRITTGEVYPLTPDAIEGVKLVESALSIIHYLEPSFWAMENPVSLLRSIIGPPSITTTYCRWGMKWLKPTDLWGDLPPGIDWNAYLCNKGEEQHELVTKHANKIERAEVPYDLGAALAKSIELFFLDGPLLEGS